MKKRIDRLDELTPDQRRIVLALIDAKLQEAHTGQHGPWCRPCWLVGKTDVEIIASGEWELVTPLGPTPQGRA